MEKSGCLGSGGNDAGGVSFDGVRGGGCRAAVRAADSYTERNANARGDADA